VAPLTLEPKITVRRGEEHALFVRLRRDREPAVREALIQRYMPLARHLARRYPAGAEREDVVQVASLALLKAVDRFDPGQGAAFTSFATPTILGEIKRYFRDFGWPVHVPRELQELAVKVERTSEAMTTALGRAPTPAELADELGTDVEHVLEALASDTAHRPIALDRPHNDESDEAPRALATTHERGYSEVEDAVALDSLLDCLPARDRLIVELRFREDMLQREIANALGISQMQVSRVLTRSIQALQDYAGGAL
jgi:RNA polymerase sigma-B factor